MATIVEENKNLRKELTDLKSSLDFSDTALRQLKEDHLKTSQMNTMLMKELEMTKEKLSTTKKITATTRRRNPKPVVVIRFA